MYIAISGNGVMGQLVRKALEIDPMLQFGGCIGPGDISSLSELPSIPDGLIDLNEGAVFGCDFKNLRSRYHNSSFLISHS